MDLNAYQQAARATAVYPEFARVLYPLLGLVGEVGELLEHVLDHLGPSSVPRSWVEAKGHCLWVGEYAKGLRDRPDYLTLDERERFQKALPSLPTELRGILGKELGDCMWMLSALAGDLGYGLGEVAQMNVEKLRDRANRGVIRGSGDQR